MLFLVITLNANAIADSNIDLTLIKDNDNTSSVAQCIKYERINPAIYIVKVDCEHGGYILSLKDLYNPGWRVYFRPTLEKDNSSTINYSFMESYVDEELKSNNKMYKIQKRIAPSIDGSVLLPLGSHFRVNKIFNGWVIDSSLIEYLLAQSKIDKSLKNKKFTLYIIFYSEIIKQLWQKIMFTIIALLLIIFFAKKIIKRIY